MIDLRRLSCEGGALEGLDVALPADAAARVKAGLTPDRLRHLPEAARDLLVHEAAPAIARVRSNQPLEFKARLAIEALILVDGRPALPTCKGEVNLQDPEATGWVNLLSEHKSALKTICAAVGRIDLAGGHVGTGFLIAPNLVLTNRHVAEVIAKPFRKDSGEVWLMKAGSPWIDFGREACDEAVSRFRILRVVAAGPDPIDLRVNPKRLDAALLEIAPTSLSSDPQPVPVTFLAPQALANEEPGQVVSIGYPGAPAYEPRGPMPTKEDEQVMASLKRIFNMTYGVKRVSPGKIVTKAGVVPDGGKSWVFTHDATTLGGASGSCVVRLAGGEARVMGLHFGGAWLAHNFAHLTAKLKQPLLGNYQIAWRL
jgi:serine protease